PPSSALAAAPTAARSQPTGFASLGSGEPDILRSYLAVLYRRRWIAIGTFAIVFVLAIVRTWSETPVYEATAEMLIDSDSPNIAFDDVMQTNRRALDYYQTQYRLLTSRSLVKQALEESGLISDPAFADPRAGAAGASTATAADPLSAVRAAASDDIGGLGSDSAAIRRFLAGLTVAPIRNSRLVDVTFASPNPIVAQRAANAIVNAYIRQTSNLRTSATKDATSFLTQMVSDQRKAVEASELALQRYREQGDATSLEDRQSVTVERIARLNEAVTRATTDRIQKETIYKQVETAQSEGAKVAPLAAVQDNVLLQRLKAEVAEQEQRKAELSQRLGANHPDMIRVTESLDRAKARLREETGTIVEGVKGQYAAAVDLERRMTEALDRQKADGLAMNRRGIDYGVLQRDAAMNRQLYETLLARTKQAGITEQLKTSTVRIVDAAELPRVPARPQRLRATAIGFIAAMVLAIGLVFSLEALDTRIKSPEDVMQRLKLASLGIVPQLAARDFQNGTLLITEANAPPHFVEAFRSLRTSILFASAERGGRSILVSSTAPGEGKTLVSSNLALALAMAGQRVLLVDADMRRPKVHEMFGCSLAPGLSNVLVGETAADAAIRPSGSDNLSLLSAGTPPPNPPELLGSVPFAELMTSMSSRFDWVVLDSPPVRAVADAAIIAHLATSVVFVVGAEMTDAASAKSAVDRLAATQGKVAGVVLNRVQLRRHSYYYARYYNRADERYYVQREGRA
ncbi:MAG: polysaccharide biosynthesis tyrosine autokinase, partial [Acidobacteriota bacterium]